MSTDNKLKDGIYIVRSGELLGPYTESEYDALRGTEPTAHKPRTRSSVVSVIKDVNWLAVCHDFRAMVSGSLQKVTEIGCDLVSPDKSHAPKMSERSTVILNLLDNDSGKSMNVQAHVAGVARTAAGWIYQLRWESCPDLG